MGRSAAATSPKPRSLLLPLPPPLLLPSPFREPLLQGLAGVTGSAGGPTEAKSLRKSTSLRAAQAKRVRRQNVAHPSAVLPALLVYRPSKPAVAGSPAHGQRMRQIWRLGR